VETADGRKAIEDIVDGDKVWAYDEGTGKQGIKAVKRLFRNATGSWHHIRVAGEDIKCTAEHPFYVVGKGFVTARELKAGDKCLRLDGKEGIIEEVWVEKLEKPETTYNFEIEDYHTYYVGDQGILVHNICENAAMRVAKRSENIPMSQNPDHVVKVKMIGENGRVYSARAELYGDKFIRNDFGGHLFPDGTTLPKHFNAGTWSGSLDNIRFIGNGIHFWYL
jgi:hypothetical protein